MQKVKIFIVTWYNRAMTKDCCHNGNAFSFSKINSKLGAFCDITPAFSRLLNNVF